MNTPPQPCPYCGRSDCPDRAAHLDYAAAVARQDAGRLGYYGLVKHNRSGS